MTGAPNCQNPVWSPEERAIIGRAWSVKEAWENHLAWLMESFNWVVLTVNIKPARSYKAIECEWLRLHPLLHSCPNTPLERELGIALDELEAVA
jgi:hypothetical protein